jgi:hypothetical protein
MKKILNKTGHYLIKLFFIVLTFQILAGATYGIVAIYLGDGMRAEAIYKEFSFFNKIFVVLMSGGIMYLFSKLASYFIKTFVLEKNEESK